MVHASVGDERRFFALRCGEGNIRDHAFFASMDKQMESGGYEAFMYALLNHKPVGGEHGIWTPPSTPYLAEQQRRSMNGLDGFWYELLRYGSYEPSDGTQPIELGDTPARLQFVDVRNAVADYLKGGPREDQSLAKFDPIENAARRWTNATTVREAKDGNVRQSRLLIVPPLNAARQFAEESLKVSFDDPDTLEIVENDTVKKFGRR